MNPIESTLERLHVSTRGYWFKWMIPIGLGWGAIQAAHAGLGLDAGVSYALGSAAMYGVASLGLDLPKLLRNGESRRLPTDQFPYLGDVRRIPAAALGVFIGTQVLQWVVGQYDYSAPTLAQQLVNGVCWGTALAAASEYLYRTKPKDSPEVS